MPRRDAVTAPASATPPPTTGPVKDLQTRFLYPFFWDRGRVKEASVGLLGATFSPRDGQPRSLWEAAEPHHLYRDELLDHVIRFLFCSPDGGGCGYFKIADVP